MQQNCLMTVLVHSMTTLKILGSGHSNSLSRVYQDGFDMRMSMNNILECLIVLLT